MDESRAVSTEAEPPPTRQRSERPVQLQGGAFTVLVLRLPDPRDLAFFADLADKVCQAPNFYRQAPVVIDLRDLAAGPPINIAEIGRRLRQHWLVPIGVQNGTDEQNQAALNAGFGVFSEGRPVAWRSADESSDEPCRAAPVQAGQTSGSASRVITRPVRSGRQAYAQGSDLVVMAAVGAGAEVVADGHIHIYGSLRGRALAGVSGDERARIFCTCMDAELISIAGYWLVHDDIPETLIGKPVEVLLEDGRVVVRPLP